MPGDDAGVTELDGMVPASGVSAKAGTGALGDAEGVVLAAGDWTGAEPALGLAAGTADVAGVAAGDREGVTELKGAEEGDWEGTVTVGEVLGGLERDTAGAGEGASLA